MNKRIIQALFFPFLMFLLFTVSACEKTYSGKVIDADTKEPIEGAVVVVSWLKARATLSGDDTNFYDVKETLTDKEGKWQIKGHKANCEETIPWALKFIGIGCIRNPEFIVFKPGYCVWPREYSIEVCKEKTNTYNLEGNKYIGETTELPKLTNKEDRAKVIPGSIHGVNAWEKQKEFIKMINKERKYQGWEEIKQY